MNFENQSTIWVVMFQNLMDSGCKVSVRTWMMQAWELWNTITSMGTSGFWIPIAKTLHLPIHWVPYMSRVGFGSVIIENWESFDFKNLSTCCKEGTLDTWLERWKGKQKREVNFWTSSLGPCCLQRSNWIIFLNY